MGVCTRTIMCLDREVQGGEGRSEDLEGGLTVVEWWGHVLEVLMKFNCSWSQRARVR